MRRKQKTMVLGFLFVTLALTATIFEGTCAQAAQKVIKIPTTTHVPPPPPPPAKAAADVQSFVDYARKVKEATDGRVVIE